MSPPANAPGYADFLSFRDIDARIPTSPSSQKLDRPRRGIATHTSVVIRPVLRVDRAAVASRHIFGVDDVFYAERHAANQSTRGAAVNRAGVGQGFFFI